MKISKSDLEKKIRQAYAKMPSSSKRTKEPNLKWPEELGVDEDNDEITLSISDKAIKSNMQSNASAFESWLFVLKELVYRDYIFSVEFQLGRKIDKIERQHYERFLFRLNLFDSLFGKGNHNSWFELSDQQNKYLASNCQYLKCNKLISNVGKGERGKSKNNDTKNLPELSESAMEWRLCKDGADSNCLKNAFKTGVIYRQFPVGIFDGEPIAKNALFPGGKACVDLVADGDNDKKSFWIFELKKKGNIPMGILTELLFYTAIIRDMVAGRIKTQKPLDKDCYDATNLVNNKDIINACFLAPDFHPLLIEPIINRLNVAFAQLKEKDNLCSVVFHKAILDMDNNEKLFIRSTH